MSHELPPSDPADPGPRDAAPAPRKHALPLALAWALLVALGGGYGCGLVLDRYGEYGTPAFWAIGALAGIVSRQITITASRTAALALVIACLLATVIAELCWIRWNIELEPDTWVAAIAFTPEFISSFQIAVLFAAIFTAFGAYSAWWRAGQKYRLVAIPVR